MGQAVIGLARAVQAHQLAIQELYAMNGTLLKAMRENSLDTKLSKGKKPEADGKPN